MQEDAYLASGLSGANIGKLCFYVLACPSGACCADVHALQGGLHGTSLHSTSLLSTSLHIHLPSCRSTQGLAAATPAATPAAGRQPPPQQHLQWLQHCQLLLLHALVQWHPGSEVWPRGLGCPKGGVTHKRWLLRWKVTRGPCASTRRCGTSNQGSRASTSTSIHEQGSRSCCSHNCSSRWGARLAAPLCPMSLVTF